MGLIYIILVYLILGLLFTYMHSGMIIWAVKNNKNKINKKFLLILSYIWITLTFPMRIYGILKKNIEIFEKGIKNNSQGGSIWK